VRFKIHVRFEVFMAVTPKTVFSDVMPCSLDANILEEPAASIFRFYLEDEDGGPSKTLMIYQTTWHHIPEYGNLEKSYTSSGALKYQMETEAELQTKIKQSSVHVLMKHYKAC
jgi:hypothetical protein